MLREADEDLQKPAGPGPPDWFAAVPPLAQPVAAGRAARLARGLFLPLGPGTRPVGREFRLTAHGFTAAAGARSSGSALARASPGRPPPTPSPPAQSGK